MNHQIILKETDLWNRSNFHFSVVNFTSYILHSFVRSMSILSSILLFYSFRTYNLRQLLYETPCNICTRRVANPRDNSPCLVLSLLAAPMSAIVSVYRVHIIVMTLRRYGDHTGGSEGGREAEGLKNRGNLHSTVCVWTDRTRISEGIIIITVNIVGSVLSLSLSFSLLIRWPMRYSTRNCRLQKNFLSVIEGGFCHRSDRLWTLGNWSTMEVATCSYSRIKWSPSAWLTSSGNSTSRYIRRRNVDEINISIFVEFSFHVYNVIAFSL